MSVCPAVDLHPSSIISEVLDDVEKRSFTPQDPDDGTDFNISCNPYCLSLGEKIPGKDACTLLVSVPFETFWRQKKEQILVLGGCAVHCYTAFCAEVGV